MTERRRGDWLQTYTGRVIWPLDPRPEEICVEDIAHGLAYTCRFHGHSKFFYSVAQHSVHVMEYVADPHKLLGLLHDAAESYIGDLPRPIKHLPGLASYREMETNLLRAILDALEVPSTYAGWKAVDEVDNRMLATEARVLMVWPPPLPWGNLLEPYTDERADLEHPWSPEEAERIFLERYRWLKGKT